MEAMFNFIPAPIALVLMLIGFAALAVGAIRLGYKQYVKDWALELVTIAEDSIMGSGQGAKKKAQVFAALRGALALLLFLLCLMTLAANSFQPFIYASF